MTFVAGLSGALAPGRVCDRCGLARALDAFAGDAETCGACVPDDAPPTPRVGERSSGTSLVRARRRARATRRPRVRIHQATLVDDEESEHDARAADLGPEEYFRWRVWNTYERRGRDAELAAEGIRFERPAPITPDVIGAREDDPVPANILHAKLPAEFGRGVAAVVPQRCDAEAYPRDARDELLWDEADGLEWRLVLAREDRRAVLAPVVPMRPETDDRVAPVEATHPHVEIAAPTETEPTEEGNEMGELMNGASHGTTLAPREQQVLAAIAGWKEKKPPTRAALTEKLGLSPATVGVYLSTLRRTGHLARPTEDGIVRLARATSTVPKVAEPKPAAPTKAPAPSKPPAPVKKPAPIAKAAPSHKPGAGEETLEQRAARELGEFEASAKQWEEEAQRLTLQAADARRQAEKRRKALECLAEAS